MNVGYQRISTVDQSLALQEDALTKAGCEKIFTDTISGAKTARPGLDQAIKFCRRDDVLVVWKLDRLGRSLPHLISVVKELNERGVEFRSLSEALDTTTPGGRLIFHIMGALAEFERDLIRERTMAGLAASRARGRKGGRPRVDPRKIALAKRLFNERDPETGQFVHTIDDITSLLKVGRTTAYRWIGKRDPSTTPEPPQGQAVP